MEEVGKVMNRSQEFAGKASLVMDKVKRNDENLRERLETIASILNGLQPQLTKAEEKCKAELRRMHSENIELAQRISRFSSYVRKNRHIFEEEKKPVNSSMMSMTQSMSQSMTSSGDLQTVKDYKTLAIIQSHLHEQTEKKKKKEQNKTKKSNCLVLLFACKYIEIEMQNK